MRVSVTISGLVYNQWLTVWLETADALTPQYSPVVPPCWLRPCTPSCTALAGFPL